MSDVFGKYSTYYDLLYEDKDYEKECDYIQSLWDEYSYIPVQSILDLGCGTGGHSMLLAQRGYDVVGIDRSETMLELAMKKAQAQGLEPTFKIGDITAFHERRTFDCAIAMFAVIGYLTSNVHLLKAFKNIKEHLNENGLFIFDVWYGPAVLSQKPGERLKIAENSNSTVYRFACPTIHAFNNTVQVDYLVLNAANGNEIRESHSMRYFFVPELKLMAKLCQFEFVKALTFPSNQESPSLSSWNITCVFKAK